MKDINVLKLLVDSRGSFWCRLVRFVTEEATF